MWLKFYILALCSVYSAHTAVQITPFKSVFSQAEGSSLEVNCSSSNSVEWTSEPAIAMPTNAVTAKTSASGDNISTLLIENIKTDNAGIFRCTDGRSGGDVSFELRIFSVVTQSATFEFEKDTTLDCNVTGDDSRQYTYKWKKGDKDVEDIVVEGKQAFNVLDNGSLAIIHPPRKFAGLYTCIAEYEENGRIHSIRVDVPFYAHPKVLPFDKSKNLVQDEKMVLECKVLGYPIPTIRWKKGDTDIKIVEGEKSRYTLLAADTYDEQPIDNARLEIESVDFDDAAKYVCVAENNRWKDFNSTQSVLVRVKDKLAALWPFLGIVAEVVILCTIIFVYEKRRNKDAMLDDEDDQDTKPEAKSENVRHRGNTNNPRA